ncbi:MAG: DUF1549 domain-containing protein [Candidatus Hydrogenedentes bacterium]|nr:DUF1549 domain-containing protein [Candidatus Hydrogenedentota bacterium]
MLGRRILFLFLVASLGAFVAPERCLGEPSTGADHWAFRPIARPEAPAVRQSAWVRSPIDAFVLSQLEAEGIAPSPEANAVTLLRRLHFDLTGLPPTPEETAAFLNDSTPDAYARLADRLLASPHFGERWGRHWLDLARYADSDGYEKDTVRPHAYRYRDWVIDALNANMPYDQFVTEQLAGDLLPEATTAQRMATGFHRNTLTNKEGGIDPEEDRVKQNVDRTNTTAAVLMGLTMGCAECHDHKYDPISQREYFSMYSFFNETLEEDIPAPRPGEAEAYKEQKRVWRKKLAALQQAVEDYEPAIAAKLPEWEAGIVLPAAEWSVLSPISYASEGGSTFERLEDHSLLLTGEAPDTDTYTVVAATNVKGLLAFRLETLTDPSLGQQGPGRAKNGNFVLNELEVYAAPKSTPHTQQKLALLTPKADYDQPEYKVADAVDGNLDTGWAIFRKEQTNEPRTATFTLAEPLAMDEDALLTFKLTHRYGRAHNIGRMRFSVTTVNPGTITLPDTVVEALRTPQAERAAHHLEALLAHAGSLDPEMAKRQKALAEHRQNVPQEVVSFAQALKQNPTLPQTRIHTRGDFLRPGDPVNPAVPAILPPLQARGEKADRLDLARWIMAPENPLTARVAANRFWEYLFGKGLARTSEDFGTRSEPPTHPELLDWLAAQFRDGGWNTKDFIRLIVNSSAYRQASTVRPELVAQDPENRLLARQNRFRVEAEITRDLFLASSGLLNDAIGGPSVRPPLPAGVADLGYAGSVKWEESAGADKYRRGLYIFFQRTVAYPMLMAFDCPDSNVTTLKRNRSNTPLQALTLLNDPVFVECAQALGRQIASAPTVETKIAEAYRRCLTREPAPREMDTLMNLVAEEMRAYAESPEAAATLAGNGWPEGITPEDRAACTVLARTIMNLDEFVTRE